MVIRIGRDSISGRLKLTSGDKVILFGEEPIPVSVLADHCVLDIDGDRIRIKNLDINTYTYINGHAVESKAITRQDRIALGKDRFVFDWKSLSHFLPANIAHLQTVWNRFEDQNISLQIAERKFNTLRSATGLITMVAIALSIATGGRSIWYMVLYAVAIIVSLAFFIKAYFDSTKMPQRRQELIRQFQHDYVCPHCGHFLGNQSYDILVQNDNCPYCKVKFIH